MILAIAVVALVALLGIAALTIDTGRAALAAQRAQEVADASALAAAKQMPDVAIASVALTNTAVANNQAVPWPAVDVDLIPPRYYHPGADVPGCGVLPDGQCAVNVTATVNDEFTFAKVVGLTQMKIERSATAIGEKRFGQLLALFADDIGIESNGGTVYIDGSIHSNTDIVFNGGGGTVITGIVEAVYDPAFNGTGIELQQGIVPCEDEPYPISYLWTDFLPFDTEVDGNWIISAPAVTFGRVHVNGDLTVTSSNFVGASGLVLVEGDVRFQGADPHLDDVTLVAKGTITFIGGAVTMTPYLDNLALVSYDATGNAIVFNGRGPATEGILFAPNGTVTFNGSAHSLHNGAIIADRIVMDGGGYSIRGIEDQTSEYIAVRLAK